MGESPIINPDELPTILNEFLSHDEVRSREFWKHFGNRRASCEIPIPDLFGYIDHAVYYDKHNIDVRLGETMLPPEDVELFRDVSRFVFEDFLNAPASNLTLRQFKNQLTRRLIQLGF